MILVFVCRQPLLLTSHWKRPGERAQERFWSFFVWFFRARSCLAACLLSSWGQLSFLSSSESEVKCWSAGPSSRVYCLSFRRLPRQNRSSLVFGSFFCQRRLMLHSLSVGWVEEERAKRRLARGVYHLLCWGARTSFCWLGTCCCARWRKGLLCWCCCG